MRELVVRLGCGVIGLVKVCREWVGVCVIDWLGV